MMRSWNYRSVEQKVQKQVAKVLYIHDEQKRGMSGEWKERKFKLEIFEELLGRKMYNLKF